MKVLSPRELPPDDLLYLRFEGARDAGATLDRELEPFLRALETYAAGWMPEAVKGKRYRKYSRAAVWKGLEEKRDENSTSVGFDRTKPPATNGSLYIGLGAGRSELWTSLWVKPLSVFAAEDRCRNLVEMVRVWASHYPVTHAHAMSEAEAELSGAPQYGRDQETWLRDGFDKIYDLPWLSVVGPKLVEDVGRQRVLSTPAYRVEEFPNGAALIVTWPIAAEFAKDEARQAQARAFVHLRPDLDYDTALRTLRERSAKLVPVEPHFHPDVAPLLSRILDRTWISKRQTQIAEFNAYRPPEPEDWLPADSAPLPDVTDRLAALEHYAFLAVHMGAIVRSKVPSVFQVTPESLTDLDFFFWHQSFPEFFDRQNIDEWAVPAIGAYLGEVLVRNLGGEWVPRKKLDESMVRVGNRAWLPFVRAWHYMRSNQSLLDYSLTQFYREADRHRT